MNRRRLSTVAVAVLAAGAAVAVVLVVLASRDDEESSPVAGRLLDPPVRLQGERDEALALIRRGRERTLHARYEAVGEAVEGWPRVVEVWRRRGQSRTDVELAAAGRVERSTTIRGPRGAVSCRRVGDAPWSCQQVRVAPEGLFDQAAADLSAAGLSARTAEIRGRQARCFTIRADEDTELCFDRSGTLLRLALGTGTIELTDSDSRVEASVFEPPAPPRG